MIIRLPSMAGIIPSSDFYDDVIRFVSSLLDRNTVASPSVVLPEHAKKPASSDSLQPGHSYFVLQSISFISDEYDIIYLFILNYILNVYISVRYA